MARAETLTRQLGGAWRGAYGTAPCPVCQPEGRNDQTALTISSGSMEILLHCKKSGCGFRSILAAAGVVPGTYATPDLSVLVQSAAQRRDAARKREDQALRLWRSAVPISGTIVEAYLRRRAIACPLPNTLRFHPAAWHVSGRRLPALVARVDGSDGFAVHRTYLRADGRGKAEVDPVKAMLGATAGGAVHLVEVAGPLVVAEGIETALSLASGILRGPAAVWAALSTSGMRGLRLPAYPGSLIIAPDGDKPGHDAAHVLAERAHALGWRVSLLPAPDGRDWNDVLLREAVTK